MSQRDVRRLFTAMEKAMVETTYQVRIIALLDAHPLTEAIANSILEDLHYWEAGNSTIHVDDGRFSVTVEIFDVREKGNWMGNWEEIDDPFNACLVDMFDEQLPQQGASEADHRKE